MSDTLEIKCLEVKLKVQVAGKGEPDFKSLTFRLMKEDWYMACGEYTEGYIVLYLISVRDITPPVAPLHVSVRVEGGPGELHECTDQVRPERTCTRIWRRKTRDVERLITGFQSGRQLTFRVTIAAKDPQAEATGGQTKCAFCGGRTECVPPLITTNASVPTPLRTTTVPCMISLSDDLTKLRDEQGSEPDMEFQCGGISIGAHKAMVGARSPVLARMLKSDKVEGRTGVVTIQDMDEVTFEQFLLYLYGGKLKQLTFDAALSLYEAGDLYAVKGLASRCSEFIAENMSADNAYDVLAVADTHGDSRLTEAVVDYMAKHKFPLSNAHWSSFSDEQPALAVKVYSLFCRENWVRRID